MALAHSKNTQGHRHDLADHLRRVAEEAATFAAPFGGGQLAYLAGILHDIGKYNPAFQQYLADAEAHPKARQRGPDHKGAGACLAHELNLDGLAFLVNGHHGGLPSTDALKEWLRERAADPAVPAAIATARVELPMLQTPAIPAFPAFAGAPREAEFFLRLLFSALVDADFLDTERHFTIAKSTQRGGWPGLDALAAEFEANQERFIAAQQSSATIVAYVNELRQEVYRACLEAAALSPGFFRLTVPTGGGKTRSSLAFALRHARAHGLRRVIYAIPYTSITEQTADEFRAIFADAHALLEHHSAIAPIEDDRNPTPEEMWARLAAENWDAPLVVTTTVQLFESLMAHSPSACRKLHRIAGSVVILDEAQALPTHLLSPILDALRQLVAHYGVSVVLCTATQPALDEQSGFAGLPDIREIVPEPERLFAALKRVEYAWPREGEQMTWDQVTGAMRAEGQALAIVNTRANAVALLAALDDPAALHLSTWMCGAHRRAVLAEVRRRLAGGESCRLVSTQVIEAGVDVDFPLVLRAMAPLDSIVQAAGRCNRNGRLAMGRVIVFVPEEERLPAGAYRTGTDVARGLLNTPGFDFHDPAVYRHYFEQLYQHVNRDVPGIQGLREHLNYPDVDKQFRMIAEDTVPVVVEYEASGHTGQAKDLLERLEKEPANARRLLRALQPYMVSVRRRDVLRAVERGTAEEMKEVAGVYRWHGSYDPVRGIDPQGQLDAATTVW
jgi:CRISPR-associated endonuclease/helicase Cas3